MKRGRNRKFSDKAAGCFVIKMEMERGRRMEVQSRMKQNKKDIFHRSSSGFMR